MTNEEILQCPTRLLKELDRQRHFLLRVCLDPAPCPACGQAVNQIDAAAVTLNDFNVDKCNAHQFRCPSCHVELVDVVPFMGPSYEWHVKTRKRSSAPFSAT